MVSFEPNRWITWAAMGLVLGMLGAESVAQAQTSNAVASAVLGLQAQVEQGGTLRARIVVEAEQEALDGVEYGVWLVPGADLSQGFELFSGNTGPVAPNRPFDREVDLSIPSTALGRFELWLQVDPDDRLTEFNETDNIEVGPVVRVLEPAPDLAVSSVSLMPNAVQVGDTLTVAVRLVNRGSQMGTGEVTVRLSDGVGIGSQDPVLARQNVSVAPGEALDLSLVFQADLPARSHVVGVRVAPGPDDRDGTNDARAAPARLQVLSDRLELNTDPLSVATVGVPYLAQLQAAGGNGKFEFEPQGELPLGLSLSTEGRLEGEPQQSGDFQLPIRVTSRDLQASGTLSLTVQASGRELALLDVAALALARFGVQYAQVLPRSGGEAPFRWEIVQGELPAGLVLEDGFIRGRPEDLGNYSFTVEVTDFRDQRAQAVYGLSVEPGVQVVIRTDPLARAEAEMPYATELQASGGIAPYRWEVLSDLPPGLELENSGRLAGNPSRVGQFGFLVRVTDSAPDPTQAESILFLTVEDVSDLAIRGPRSERVPVRNPLELTWEAEGGTPPYRWTLVPGSRLPRNTGFVTGQGELAGLGVLAGTPTEPGTFGFGVRLTDGAGRRREIPAALQVRVDPSLQETGGCQGGPSALGGACGVLAGVGLLRRRRQGR